VAYRLPPRKKVNNSFLSYVLQLFIYCISPLMGLAGETGRNEPLGRPRRRWMGNIRMDLHEVGCGYMDWIGLAQKRDRWRTLVSAVMNIPVP